MAEFETQNQPEILPVAAQTPGFREEARTFWQSVPRKEIFFPLLLAWLLLFHFLGNSTFGHVPSPSLFVWMYGLYNSPFHHDDHGMVMPFVVLALFWWKRSELMAVEKRLWKPGLAVLAAGLLLHVVGFMVQQGRLSVVGLFLGVFGLMGMVWGPVLLRASVFPYVLFLFCVPLGSLSERIGFPLRMLSTKLTVAFSHIVFGVSVVQDGTRIIEPGGRFEYEVAAACGGLRSLSAMVMLAVVFGALSFRTWWKRVAIFALAFPLAVISNVVRLLAIILAAQAFGQEAGLFVHDNSVLSLLPYLPAVLVLVALGRWLGEESKPATVSPILKVESQPPQVGGERGCGDKCGKAAFVRDGWIQRKWILCGAALGVMLAGGMLMLRLQTSQKLGAPGVKMVKVGTGLKGEVILPETLPGYASKPVPISPVEMEMLPADTSFGRRSYRAEDGFEALTTVVLMGTDRTSIHRPEFCLLGQGWTINQSELKNIAIDQPHPYSLPVMKLTATRQFESEGRSFAMRGVYVYWFVAENRLTAKHWQRMWWMAADLIRTGVLERWAYVTFFAVCPPGQEQATFERLSGLIAATVPKFQLTTGPREVVPEPVRVTVP